MKNNTPAVQSKTTVQNKNKLARRRGQGMTEYIIIVALIAIAAIGIITIFGENIRALFAVSADALAGADDVANKTQTGNIDAVKTKKLSNFGNENKGKF